MWFQPVGQIHTLALSALINGGPADDAAHAGGDANLIGDALGLREAEAEAGRGRDNAHGVAAGQLEALMAVNSTLKVAPKNILNQIDTLLEPLTAEDDVSVVDDAVCVPCTWRITGPDEYKGSEQNPL